MSTAGKSIPATGHIYMVFCHSFVVKDVERKTAVTISQYAVEIAETKDYFFLDSIV